MNCWIKRNILVGAFAAHLCVHAQAHIHIQAALRNGAWDLHIFDLEAGRIEAAEYAFPVVPAARKAIPSTPAFGAFLGQGGGPVWILPQNEEPGIAGVGFSTFAIPSGTFVDNQIKLTLRRVEGPGQFAIYNSDAFGAPVVHMSSFDGLDSTKDFIQLRAVAAHVHANFAFTAAGIYRVGFSASGILRSSGEAFESDIVDYTFIVEAPSPPRMLGPVKAPDGSFFFIVQSEGDGPIEVQKSSQLAEWRTITNIIDAAREIELRVPFASNADFFRAVLR